MYVTQESSGWKGFSSTLASGPDALMTALLMGCFHRGMFHSCPAASFITPYQFVDAKHLETFIV